MAYIYLGGIGNTALVDSTNGLDARASVGGYPYATIAAALADIASGQIIFLTPGTHTVGAGITIPSGVCIEGISRMNSVISLLGAGGDTTLVTMAADSCLRTLSLRLTSAAHHTLKGVEVAGAVSQTAQLEDVQIEVDNSGASDGGTSNVYGIHTSGSGSPKNHFNGFRRCHITVKSARLGNKRAHYIDAANGMRSRNCDYVVERTGAGAGSYIAVETAHASATADIISARLDGTPTADISQTLGTLSLTSSVLINNTANAKGLEHGNQIPVFIWGDSGNVTSGTRYWRFGDGTSNTTEPSVLVTSPCTIHDLTVRAVTGPGAARTDTFTIRRNGGDTALVTSLTAAATDAQERTISVAFAAGDRLSLMSVVSAGSTLADVVISVEAY